MSYPTSEPKNKHDVQLSQELPEDGKSLISDRGFSTSMDLFRAVENETIISPQPFCTVYSYSDGPDFPGPISRGLVVLGVADVSLSLVRKIVSNDEVPDCMHKCTIAVKLADAAHLSKLPPRHQKNSLAFAGLMKRLREEDAVAIIGKDKHGRFGILVPMRDSSVISETSAEITAKDCAASFYIGVVEDVRDFLTSRTSAPSQPTPVEAKTSDLWQPDSSSSSNQGLWKPPEVENEHNDGENTYSAPWDSVQNDSNVPWESNQQSPSDPWSAGDASAGSKRPYESVGNEETAEDPVSSENNFHSNEGAAAADAFYSGLTRSLDTRADSHLYHMRAFNGWVKATQIQELDPKIISNGKFLGKSPLRVLDLACGKGGDLTKWTLHDRGISNYVGIDVARGSLKDAAIRAREMRKKRKLSTAVFSCADLGEDVPGRRKHSSHKHMQKLLTWSLKDEDEYETSTPEFKMRRGGGISEKDKFDVVSIQFAIHYMMSTRARARRFFHTVSELLEIGGNLICTTIDARVVVGELLNLGLDLHFQSSEADFKEAVVEAGAGACKIKFEPDIVKRIISSESEGRKAEDDLFGLQYAFTLVEGSDHAAGVGDAVNLPEWLTPIPVLMALGEEAGLEIEYAQNFHEFFDVRKNQSEYPAAHHALYNMKVLNRDGSISKDEWSVSRLYAAIKFRKVRESSISFEQEAEEIDDDNDDDNMEDDQPPKPKIDPMKAKKLFPMAMMKAKRLTGADNWNTLSSEEKSRLTQIELEKLVTNE